MGSPSRGSPAPQTTVAETGVTWAAAAISASPVRLAAQPAFRTRPGASTTAASGSTVAAAPSSLSEEAAPRDRHQDRLGVSSPARRTMAKETGVTSVAAATFAFPARSAARPAFRIRPGASTVVASGSIAAVARTSASANQPMDGQETVVAGGSCPSLNFKLWGKNPSGPETSIRASPQKDHPPRTPPSASPTPGPCRTAPSSL
jgi:hypothetical protein